MVLGIAGLLLPCCPLVPLAGLVLGAVARANIRRRAGALGGGRLALAGLLLGAAGLLGQMLLLQSFASHLERSIEEACGRIATEAWRAAESGDAAAAATAAGWPWQDPAIAAMLADAAEADRRYGGFRHVLLSEFRIEQGPDGPTAAASSVWQFERRRLVGRIGWEIGPEVDLGTMAPKVRLRSLLISDPREGDLEVRR